MLGGEGVGGRVTIVSLPVWLGCLGPQYGENGVVLPVHRYRMFR